MLVSPVRAPFGGIMLGLPGEGPRARCYSGPDFFFGVLEWRDWNGRCSSGCFRFSVELQESGSDRFPFFTVPQSRANYPPHSRSMRRCSRVDAFSCVVARYPFCRDSASPAWNFWLRCVSCQSSGVPVAVLVSTHPNMQPAGTVMRVRKKYT